MTKVNGYSMFGIGLGRHITLAEYRSYVWKIENVAKKSRRAKVESKGEGSAVLIRPESTAATANMMTALTLCLSARCTWAGEGCCMHSCDSKCDYRK